MAKAARKGPSEFSKLAQSSKYTKAWKDARKLEVGDSFSNPILPNGQYVAQVTKSQCGVTKGKELYWSYNWTITRGEHKGTTGNFFHMLEPTPVGDKGMTKMGLAVIDAKRLGYEFDDSPSPADFEGIAAELSQEKPSIQISAKNKEIEKVDKKTKRKSKQKVCNLRLERLLGDDTEGDEDEEIVEDENEEGDEAEDENEEGDEGDAEGEDEAGDQIEKGDTVKGKLNGSKKIEEWLVVSVNTSKGTAKVKHPKTKKVHEAQLDELELVYED